MVEKRAESSPDHQGAALKRASLGNTQEMNSGVAALVPAVNGSLPKRPLSPWSAPANSSPPRRMEGQIAPGGHRRQRNRYSLPTATNKIDRARVHQRLSRQSYWAKGRNRETQDAAIDARGKRSSAAMTVESPVPSISKMASSSGPSAPHLWENRTYGI